ncbi:MAG TPA: sugar nucleotide-binding protein [Candidatus Dormibacteraeota bacterium]|nr:sugar nucleotide-binding protein [Candidatus Dormibacteraeota bacterium]
MILVTGAGGFVGRHVLAHLAGHGLPVRGMVRPGDDALRGRDDLVEADLTFPTSLGPALKGVEVVVHAAAITADRREPRPGAYAAVNQGGTENLVRRAAAARVGRVVLISGLGTRAAPEGTYMATRWGMEEAVRGSGIPWVVLQPSIMFGAGAPFLATLAALVRRAPAVPVINPGVRLQPLWIEDLARCVEGAIRDPSVTGRTLPLGGGEQLTMRELTLAICDALDRHPALLPLPLGVADLQARVMTAILPRPPLTPASLELLAFENVAGPGSVERPFGFRPDAVRAHLAEHGLELGWRASPYDPGSPSPAVSPRPISPGPGCSAGTSIGSMTTRMRWTAACSRRTGRRWGTPG